MRAIEFIKKNRNKEIEGILLFLTIVFAAGFVFSSNYWHHINPDDFKNNITASNLVSAPYDIEIYQQTPEIYEKYKLETMPEGLKVTGEGKDGKPWTILMAPFIKNKDLSQIGLDRLPVNVKFNITKDKVAYNRWKYAFSFKGLSNLQESTLDNVIFGIVSKEGLEDKDIITQGTDIVIGNIRISFDDLKESGYDIAMDKKNLTIKNLTGKFTGIAGSKNIEFDPTITISADDVYVTANTVNLDNEPWFSHLEVNRSEYPWKNLSVYYTFDEPDLYWQSGVIGNSLRFDGLNDKAYTYGADLFHYAYNFSYSFWIRSFDVSSDKQTILDQCSGSDGFVIYQNGSKILVYVFTTILFDLTPDNTIRYNNWTHVTILWDASIKNWTAYINGNWAGSENEPSTNPYTSLITTIGKDNTCFSTGSNYYNGNIDEMMIFNRTLESLEIYNLYSQQAAGTRYLDTDGGLTNYWRFDEYNGQTPMDNGLDNNTLVGIGFKEWNNYAGDGLNGAANYSFWNMTTLCNFKYGCYVNNSNARFSLGWIRVDETSTFGIERTQEFTVSLWLKRNQDNPSSSGDVILTRQQPSVTAGGYPFSIDDTGGSLRFAFRNSSGVTTITIAGATPTGVWRHVLVTRNTSNWTTFYIDGVFNYTMAILGNANTPANYPTNIFNIRNTTAASGGVSESMFWGGIDELMIFNTSIDENMVSRIYLNQSKRFVPSGHLNISNQTHFTNITSGSYNRINVTTKCNQNGSSSITLMLGLYNGSWSHTDNKAVVCDVPLTFEVATNNANITLNYTLKAGNITELQFYTPLIYNSIRYLQWNEGGAGDSTPPTITLYSPNTSYYNTTTINLLWNATDETALDKIWYNYTSGNTTITTNLSFTALEWSSNITIWANDTSNNQARYPYNLRVDTQPPNTTISNSSGSFYNEKNITITGWCSDDGDADLSFVWSNNTYYTQTYASPSQWNMTNTSALPYGSMDVYISCNDTYGNSRTRNITLTINYTTQPEENISSYTNITRLNLFSGNTTNENTTSILTNYTEYNSSYNEIYQLPNTFITSTTGTIYNSTWMEFDGSGDYVKMTNSNLTDIYNFSYDDSFTVITRVMQKARATTGAGLGMGLCGNIWDVNSRNGWAIYIYNDTGNEAFIWTIGNGSNRTTATIYQPTGTKNLTLDEWYDLAFIKNGSTFTLYINGNYTGSSSFVAVAGTANTLQEFSIGRARGDGNYYWNGSIDFLVIYNETLTPKQINTSNWNRGRPTPSIDASDISTVVGYSYIDSNYDIYGFTGLKLYKSIDNATSFSEIYDFAGYSPGIYGGAAGTANLLTKDRNNNSYASYSNNGRLFRSQANADGSTNMSNWTTVLNLSCENGSVWGTKSFIEMPNGNLIVGEYSSGAMAENCSVAYKSTDNGSTWSVFYNDSEWTSTYPGGLATGRHFHYLRRDNYTGYIYGSIGDSTGRYKTIRTKDNGTTWERVFSNDDSGFVWQPTDAEFGDGFRLFFEDRGGGSAYSRVAISTDDETVRFVFNNNEILNGNLYWSIKTNNGYYYTGMSDVSGSPGSMYGSENGYDWYIADILGVVATDYPSNIDTNNTFYIKAGAKNRKIITVKQPSLAANFKLNDINNTVTYDDFNLLYGNITGNTFFSSDYMPYNLTENYDYLVNSTTGQVNFTDKQLANSKVNMSYSYSSGDSIYNYMLVYYPFDSFDGARVYDYTNKNNITTGSSVVNSSIVQGIIGHAINFTPTGYALMPRTNSMDSINITGRATIALWGYFNQEYYVSNRAFLELYQSSTNKMFLYYQGIGGEKLCIQNGIQNASEYRCTSTNITRGIWNNIVAVFNTDNSTDLYVNGIEDANFPYTFNRNIGLIGNYTTYIGRSGSQLTYLNGSIDELMIFNTSLTTTNIQAIYNNQSERYKYYGNYTNASISLGNLSVNRINVLGFVTTPVSSNIRLLIGYKNASGWFHTASQLFTGNNTFNITNLTTDVTFNFTFSTNQYAFMTPYIRNPTNYTGYFEYEGAPPVVDTEAPTITLYSPNATYTNSSFLWILFNATDNVSIDKIWYNYTSSVNVTITGNITIKTNHSNNTFTLWVNDTSGNINHSEWVVSADLMPPNVTIDNVTSSYDDNVSVTIQGTCADTGISSLHYAYTNSTYFLGVDSSPAIFNFTNITALNAGWKYTYIFCNDTYGNNVFFSMHTMLINSTAPPVVYPSSNNTVSIMKCISRKATYCDMYVLVTSSI